MTQAIQPPATGEDPPAGRLPHDVHVPPATWELPADAPHAQVTYHLVNHQHNARNVRIAQLETYIRDAGLPVPPDCEGWERR